MKPNSETNLLSQEITIHIHEEKEISGDISITYSSYEHEHVSSAPNSPFAATTGIYSFLITDTNASESIVIFQDRNKTPKPIFWKKLSADVYFCIR